MCSASDYVGIRACALLVQHLDCGALSFRAWESRKGVVAFPPGFNHEHGVRSIWLGRSTFRAPKRPSQSWTSAFTPKACGAISLQVITAFALIPDADPGTVHQARTAYRHYCYRAASKGERAQPEDDGHCTCLPLGLGVLQSRWRLHSNCIWCYWLSVVLRHIPLS